MTRGAISIVIAGCPLGPSFTRSYFKICPTGSLGSDPLCSKLLKCFQFITCESQHPQRPSQAADACSLPEPTSSLLTLGQPNESPARSLVTIVPQPGVFFSTWVTSYLPSTLCSDVTYSVRSTLTLYFTMEVSSSLCPALFSPWHSSLSSVLDSIPMLCSLSPVEV